MRPCHGNDAEMMGKKPELLPLSFASCLYHFASGHAVHLSISEARAVPTAAAVAVAVVAAAAAAWGCGAGFNGSTILCFNPGIQFNIYNNIGLPHHIRPAFGSIYPGGMQWIIVDL